MFSLTHIAILAVTHLVAAGGGWWAKTKYAAKLQADLQNVAKKV